MFKEWCKKNDLRNLLLSVDNYHPYPTVDEREQWNSIPEDLRQKKIKVAEEYLNMDWPCLPAALFLEYTRFGNRRNFEKLHFKRRSILTSLVMAECIEGKGRFIDDIINGIWHTCEESFWGLPAHNRRRQEHLALPDVTEPIVDLFAAETGGQLAFTYYLLKTKLDEVTPIIGQRIKLEVKRRLLDPYLNSSDYWWMGYYATVAVNNWNPWINSNCLTAFLLLEDDVHRRFDGVYKIMYTLDHFMDVYHPDGGCDEGPSYWCHAGASLFDCLDQLYHASNGKINFFNQSLVKEIGRYILRVHISDDYFINFADGGSKVELNGDLTYRYGRHIGDQQLMDFGACYLMNHLDQAHHILSLLREIPLIFNYREILASSPKNVYLRDSWLPGIQVMVAREQENSEKGLYLAAKGGHNDESHNHNDLGHFIVYLDGKPAIIDVGVEGYTSKTFSEQRYEIWTMQSAFHNLPTVNGMQQAPGQHYCATDLSYSASDDKVDFSLDISKAYPEESGISFWKRHFVFNRNEDPSIEITDCFDLKKATNNITITLMTHLAPELCDSSSLIIHCENNKKLRVQFDPILIASIEKIALDDANLQFSWGDSLYRVLLKVKEPVSSGTWKMKVTQA